MIRKYEQKLPGTCLSHDLYTTSTYYHKQQFQYFYHHGN